MEKVLFVCGHNSGRSQIAEAYLKHLGKNKFKVTSAGLKPHDAVNPLVIKVMKEENIDISHNKPKAVFDLVKNGALFSYVITVCDKETDKNCPIFPGIQKRENWPFPEPRAVDGTYKEKLDQVRTIRDDIKSRIIEYFNLTP
ncbi:MAG: arsenate reductase ArsC [Thermodesulfobacteriota bacterium]|nr:arsenate reductase ArsC [Thermodesulfobacteriota bacterium]